MTNSIKPTDPEEGPVSDDIEMVFAWHCEVKGNDHCGCCECADCGNGDVGALVKWSLSHVLTMLRYAGWEIVPTGRVADLGRKNATLGRLTNGGVLDGFVSVEEGGAMSIEEFLLARLAEDEEAARAATPGPWVAYDMGDDVYTSENKAGWWWVWQESRLPYYGGVLEIGGFGKPDVDDRGDPRGAVGGAEITDGQDGNQEKSDAVHISRHHPTRVLAEIAAKRHLVTAHHEDFPDGERYALGWRDFQAMARQVLAAAYADHSDYDQKWAI